jgi:5-formyltetrahydrofolate cyclo-ligase
MPTEDRVDSEKRVLRSQFARSREAVLPTDRQRMDALISQHLVQYASERDKLTIALYAAFRGEADLSFCLKRLKAQRHRIVFPKTDKQTKRLSFHQVWKPGDLIIGNYGIYEPASIEENLVLEEQIDIVCVPGLAFTRSGIRLGYGGGFYDRLFENKAVMATRIGVAYGVQVVESLPESLHDSRMNYLLTEEGWTACGR